MNKIDKIYFDIDGVLKGTASPQEDVIALIRYCLDNYCGSLYWLTTHYKRGENQTNYALLSDVLPAKLVEEMYQTFKPTNWEVLKTDVSI